MGSAKHIRNNGEQINIHGHDNYQMPGAYKQMGDMNQNQSLGAYKLVGDQPELDKNRNGKIDGEDFEMMQPGKISGGAAKYIKEAYGAGKIGDPTDPKKNKKNITTGDVSFKIDDSGATLTKNKTVTSNTPSSSSSKSSTPIVDKGEDVFYNNLTSSAKDMSAMAAAGIDVNDRKAVLNYGNTKAKNMKSSSSSSTSSSSSSENNPVTIKSINSASNYAMQEMLGDKNKAVYAGEMQAKKDSATAYQKTFKNLLENNSSAGLSNKVLKDFGDISGRYGNKEANATRRNYGIPEVKSKTQLKPRTYGDIGGGRTGTITPSYKNTNAPGGRSRIANAPTTYSRSTPIYADFSKLYGPENDGPNKIHSSNGYGINKILGDIEKNMSEGSTKKRYKH
jgi:hypothetical protein